MGCLSRGVLPRGGVWCVPRGVVGVCLGGSVCHKHLCGQTNAYETRMHSSRMRTTHLLPISPCMHSSGWGCGVYLVPGGGGVPGPGGYLIPGVYLVLGGVPGPGVVYLFPGVVPGPRGVRGAPGPGGCTWSGGYTWSRRCTWSGGVPGPGGTCPGTPRLREQND